MKKQIKETSFWKPEKISSTRVIRGSPLFDFPGSKRSNPYKQNNKSNMFMTGFIPKTKYISPIYAQPKKVPIPSHMGINPKPVHPINMNTNVPKKDMNWFQAKSKFPKLNPFGDADHDGVINMLDCKPFDKLMQDAKSRAYFKKFNKKVAKPIDEKSIKAINKIIKSQDLEGLYLAGKQAADVAKLKNNTVKNSSIEKIKLFSPEITIRKSSIKRQDIPESKLVTTPLTPEEQADYFEQIVRGMEPYMNQDKVYDVPEVIENTEKENKKSFKKEPTPTPNIVKETNIPIGNRQLQAQIKKQEIKIKQSRDTTQQGGFDTNIKNSIKNLSENKDMAKLQELLVEEKDIGTRKVIERQLKILGNIELKKLDNEQKLKNKELESLTRKEEALKKLEGIKTKTELRVIENISREKNIKNRELKAITEEQKRLTRERDREYQRGYIAARGNKVVRVKTPTYTSAKIFENRYEKRQEKYYPKEIPLPTMTSGFMGSNRLKEIEEELKGKSRATGKEYNYLGPIVRTEKYLKPQEMITGELIKSRKVATSKYEPVMTPEGKWKGTYKEKNENYPYKFDKYKNIIKKEKPQPYAVKILEDVKREDQILEDRKRNIIDKYIAKKELESKNPSTINVFPIKTQKGDKEMLPIRLEEAKEKYPLTVADEMRGAKARKITKISEEEYNTPMTAYEYVEKDKTKKEREIKEERQQQQEQKKVEMDKMKEERERRKEDIQRKQEERAIEVAAMKEEKNVIESPKEKNEIDTQYEKETGLGEYSGAQNIIDEA